VSIIDGKETSRLLNQNLKISINEMMTKGNRAPKLVAIQVGDNSASSLYIRNKRRACENVGILFEHISIESTTTQDELSKLIDKYNNDESCDGILVQLPLPDHLNSSDIIAKISPEKDADGFNPITLGNVMLNKKDIFPSTPKGIIRLLQQYNVPIEGANVVIVGRSNIVGKPVANMLINLSATVTVCHSKTKNLQEITKKADILIVAIGRAKFITKDFVSSNAVIIDVGINKTDDGFCGDVDFEELKDYVKAITPVPGGVGPMTVSSLLDNVFKLYMKKM